MTNFSTRISLMGLEVLSFVACENKAFSWKWRGGDKREIEKKTSKWANKKNNQIYSFASHIVLQRLALEGDVDAYHTRTLQRVTTHHFWLLERWEDSQKKWRMMKKRWSRARKGGGGEGEEKGEKAFFFFFSQHEVKRHLGMEKKENYFTPHPPAYLSLFIVIFIIHHIYYIYMYIALIRSIAWHACCHLCI